MRGVDPFSVPAACARQGGINKVSCVTKLSGLMKARGGKRVTMLCHPARLRSFQEDCIGVSAIDLPAYLVVKAHTAA